MANESYCSVVAALLGITFFRDWDEHRVDPILFKPFHVVPDLSAEMVVELYWVFSAILDHFCCDLVCSTTFFCLEFVGGLPDFVQKWIWFTFGLQLVRWPGDSVCICSVQFRAVILPSIFDV